MQIFYANDDWQVGYSKERRAVGEWYRGKDRWIFAGWLWDGKVETFADARKLIDDHFGMTP